MTRQFADNVIIYTASDESLSKLLREDGVMSRVIVDARPILHLEAAAPHSIIVHFEDGATDCVEFLVHGPRTEINGPYTHQLGLDLNDRGDIKISGPLYTTTVPSVFAVGDCACSTKDVLQAMATGALGAKGISAELVADM
ncbi:hypothetical protein EYZ11_003675 [Aspergillus tanneri]|uniref:FAD/NAD(P)-binding domain-containing protein n=1 Tax=Aspergillus tanneri TaxID=1220188 RepID=A0A4S3JT96_9EURO|nr:uncharacterized protein ATNIH1004_006719 [Aspergillus tanneri]KAA8645300.1 hypothetical protein ATNIH1004_006719 [Aspergillus tanneri]THC96851.1 hypothetical protein EYZ11_003675 [Aspergillus tanneri]